MKPVLIELTDVKTKEKVDSLEVDACLVATGRAPYTHVSLTGYYSFRWYRVCSLHIPCKQMMATTDYAEYHACVMTSTLHTWFRHSLLTCTLATHVMSSTCTSNRICCSRYCAPSDRYVEPILDIALQAGDLIPAFKGCLFPGLELGSSGSGD